MQGQETLAKENSHEKQARNNENIKEKKATGG